MKIETSEEKIFSKRRKLGQARRYFLFCAFDGVNRLWCTSYKRNLHLEEWEEGKILKSLLNVRKNHRFSQHFTRSSEFTREDAFEIKNIINRLENMHT